MKALAQKELYMVSLTNEKTPTDPGCRVVRGRAALGDLIAEKLGPKLTKESRLKMVTLLEKDEAAVLEMFQGRSRGVSLYSENEMRQADVYLVTGSYGL